MKAYRRLTPDEARAAHAEYMAGETYRVLAREYDVCEDTLATTFRALGLRGKGGRGHSTELDGVKVKDDEPYALYLNELLRMAV